jgi:hypothetical protein
VAKACGQDRIPSGQISTVTKKITSTPNSDGLINCLRQPGQLQSQPLKSMREKFLPFIEFCAPRQFHLPGQSLRRAAGHRAGALFFAQHRDYFIVTRNFSAVYLDLVPSRSFTVTRSSLPFTGTGKKTRHRDADGT